MKLVDPTLRDRRPTAVAAAPRPPVDDGRPLGLLANGKTHSMRLLELMADRLVSRHGIDGLVRVTKPNPSAPADETTLRMLNERCLAVLSAVGD